MNQPESTNRNDSDDLANTNSAEVQTDRFKLFVIRAEQGILAGILIACSIALALYVFLQVQRRNGLIDIDQAPPRTAIFQIDINQAEWPELATLPGIGESMARAIIEYREANGPLRTIDDLLEIDGIGPKRIEAIKPFLLISDGGNLLVDHRK